MFIIEEKEEDEEGRRAKARFSHHGFISWKIELLAIWGSFTSHMR